MKILMTGSLGTIGRTLTRVLEARGHEVLGCDVFHGEGENFSRCDVRHLRQVERLFDGQSFEYVYHLAAEYGRWNGEDYYENLWLTNAVGTKNIVTMQQRHQFRLIHFSSAEVYGDYDQVMVESVMDTVPIKQMNDYAMTKWVNEMQILNSASMFGTESVRVRPVNVYGPGEPYHRYRGVVPTIIYKALTGRPYTIYQGHKRIFDYVDDTCRTLANIVENFVSGEVYNLGGKPEWESEIKHISDLVLNHLGLDDSQVTYREAEPFTTRVKTIDSSKAIRDLDHDPQVTLEVGIPRTIDWMRRHYAINEGGRHDG